MAGHKQGEINRVDVQELVDAVGSRHGTFSTKCNRIAKLIACWPTLEAKFVSMIERGNGSTETARLAYATLLMMETGIRTGNESSAEGWICENQIICRKANKAKKLKVGDVIWQHPEYGKLVKTYGLISLLNSHIKKYKKRLEIDFVGKKLVDQKLIVKNPTLVQYCDFVRGGHHTCCIKPDNTFLDIAYNDLKKFVKRSVGKGYTPKDLRMAKVNLIFIDLFGNDPRRTEFEDATTKSERKKILTEVIEETANTIGHTKGVCRSAYLSAPLLSTIMEN